MHRCKERQMNKKYIVQLTPDQRVMLEHLTRTGITTAAKQRHARILLKADAGSEGPAWEDAAIAAAVEVSVPTVERIRRVFVTQGLEGALQRKPTTRASQRKLDGVQEAQLAAIACSPPPEGAERWTLALLADKLVELKVVDSIARDTVRVALKKTSSSRG
jgi:transposase